MHILVICGHPTAGSLCESLAASYTEHARKAGHTVESVSLSALQFDPVLRNGFHGSQQLEPCLAEAQEMIQRANHLVFIYPSWWGNLPAILKGFIDRVFEPGFAFRYREDSPLPLRLLRGKTARLILTMDAPRLWNFLAYRDANIHSMKQATLKFCGIRPVRTTVFGNVRSSDEARRKKWLAETARLGKNGL